MTEVRLSFQCSLLYLGSELTQIHAYADTFPNDTSLRYLLLCRALHKCGKNILPNCRLRITSPCRPCPPALCPWMLGPQPRRPALCCLAAPPPRRAHAPCLSRCCCRHRRHPGPQVRGRHPGLGCCLPGRPRRPACRRLAGLQGIPTHFGCQQPPCCRHAARCSCSQFCF